MDQLLHHNRATLEQIFNWAHSDRTVLLLIGIANSLKFPEECLEKMESAKYHPSTVVFQKYSRDDLTSILLQRVGDIIEEKGIKLCAMRTANVEGDARVALGICKQAVEKAKAEIETKSEEECASLLGNDQVLVTTKHILAASSRKDGSVASCIQACTTYAQIILCVALSPLVPEGEPLSKEILYRAFKNAGVMSNIGDEEFNDAFEILVENGLLAAKGTSNNRILTLNASKEDLKTALPNQGFLSTILTKTRV